MTKWTEFMDMHSGGGQKLDWAYIFIEAPEDEARVIFYNLFHRNPERVTCTCCGSDYSITEHDGLDQATAYLRGCDYAYFDQDGNEMDRSPSDILAPKDWASSRYVERPNTQSFRDSSYKSLEEFLKVDWIKVIYAADIQPDQRTGDVPDEGYVWAGGDSYE